MSGSLLARRGGSVLESAEAEVAATMPTAVGDRILESFLRPFTIGSYESKTTASIGATVFCGSFAVDDLMKRTDLAMYSVKEHGRNAIRFFDPAMQTEVETRAALRSDLRRALQNNEFELHYQPQMNRDGSVESCEALLRWQHPLRGNVAPAEFILRAEEAGLIMELGRWVLETACRQLAAWATNPEMEDLTWQ